jgi:hypothetical protein
VDAKSPLLKSQFASKSCARRAGAADERNGTNAKKQTRETMENIFGHFIRIRIAIFLENSGQPIWLVAWLLYLDYPQSTL